MLECAEFPLHDRGIAAGAMYPSIWTEREASNQPDRSWVQVGLESMVLTIPEVVEDHFAVNGSDCQPSPLGVERNAVSVTEQRLAPSAVVCGV